MTPVAPTLTEPACGEEATVVVTEVTGLSHTEVRNGYTVTITFAPESADFEIADGAQTTWELTIPAIVDCPAPTEVTPAAPTLVDAPSCGVEPTVNVTPTDGVTYTQTRDGNIITVTATANSTPAPGYVIAPGAETTWSFDVTPEICPCVATQTFERPDGNPTGYVHVFGDSNNTDIYNFESYFADPWLSALEDVNATITVTSTTAEVSYYVYGYDEEGNYYLDDEGNFAYLEGTVTVNGNGPTLTLDMAPFRADAEAQFLAQYPDAFRAEAGAYWLSPNVTFTLDASYDNGCEIVSIFTGLAIGPRGGGGGNN